MRKQTLSLSQGFHGCWPTVMTVVYGCFCWINSSFILLTQSKRFAALPRQKSWPDMSPLSWQQGRGARRITVCVKNRDKRTWQRRMCLRIYYLYVLLHQQGTTYSKRKLIAANQHKTKVSVSWGHDQVGGLSTLSHCTNGEHICLLCLKNCIVHKKRTFLMLLLSHIIWSVSTQPSLSCLFCLKFKSKLLPNSSLFDKFQSGLHQKHFTGTALLRVANNIMMSSDVVEFGS